jgi:hypothetical protein
VIGTLQCVVLDCPDALELARFYQALLGGAVNQPDRRWAVGDGFSTLHTESGLVFAFQRVQDFRAPILTSRTSTRPMRRSCSSARRYCISTPEAGESTRIRRDTPSASSKADRRQARSRADPTSDKPLTRCARSRSTTGVLAANAMPLIRPSAC